MNNVAAEARTACWIAIITGASLAFSLALAAALLAAFAVYEVALFAATVPLPSGPGAFAPSVVLGILWTNLLALAGLLLLHRLAALLGLTLPPAPPVPPLGA